MQHVYFITRFLSNQLFITIKYAKITRRISCKCRIGAKFAPGRANYAFYHGFLQKNVGKYRVHRKKEAFYAKFIKSRKGAFSFLEKRLKCSQRANIFGFRTSKPLNDPNTNIKEIDA